MSATITELITLTALVAGMVGMFLALRRQSAAGINVAALTNRQQDTESELLTLRAKVDRLETLLSEKEEMLRVVTKEVLGIQRKLLDAENELARIGKTHDSCRSELQIAKRQIEALQSTVEKQTDDLKSMEEIQEDAERHRMENFTLKRRIEELIAGDK